MSQVSHPIAKDLNAVWLRFASSIDTVIAAGIKKTVLLKSSPYSARLATPHIVSLGKLYNPPPRGQFRESAVPLAVLLEGKFTSAFKNRLRPKAEAGLLKTKEESSQNQMLVVADGDIIRNQFNVINPNIPKGAPLPLGYDQYTNTQYGNKDFLVNSLDYMLDDQGLIAIRSRELKIRLLDLEKVKEERLFWQLINTLIPAMLIVLMAVVNTWWRRKKYLKS